MVDDVANLREPVARLRTATAAALAASADSPLRQLLEAIADAVRDVAAEAERLYDHAFVGTDPRVGLYRGIVVSTADPTGRGRLQVIVPALSNEPLGWAEPSLPLGAAEGQPPASGAAVWVMFEEGDPGRAVAVGSRPV